VGSEAAVWSAPRLLQLSLATGGILMDMLRIRLFGSVRVGFAGSASTVKMTHSVQALLAYLVLYRDRAHSRDVLVGQFWGDTSEERARHALNTTLWRLRRVLRAPEEPGASFILTTDAGEIGFNRHSSYWLDVAVFEKAARRLLAAPVEAASAADVAAMEQSLQLYCCDLLEGFYDDWALRERERLRLLHLQCLTYLMQYHKQQGACEKSLARGREILDRDPLREEIHREMMRLYLENGQRALAIRQYQILRQVLAVELGIPPMEESQALYRQMAPAQVASEPADPTLLRQALQQLQHAMSALGSAEGDLQRAIQRVEMLAGHLDSGVPGPGR
jgi:DNA-binding SARP family transcriptional activator